MMLSLLFRWVRRIVFLVAFAGMALIGYAALRTAPQNLPWTTLQLDQPIGLFTPRKLVQLSHARPECLALLRTAGIRFQAVSKHGDAQCRALDGVRLRAGQPMLTLAPASVAPSCPVTAGLLLWQTKILQPLAQRIFGISVARLEHYGSYSCRRIYGRSEGSWSEHATGNAIDISAVVLSDGTRISVVRDWSPKTKKGRFLRAARDGACTIFSTVLSPDYNAAHRDHLHIDMADRGEIGWRACR